MKCPLFLVFFTLFFGINVTSAFSANECSHDKVYAKECAHLPVVESYRCVLNAPNISKPCFNKAEAVLRCSADVLTECNDPKYDHGNAFEQCVTDRGCSDIALYL